MAFSPTTALATFLGRFKSISFLSFYASVVLVEVLQQISDLFEETKGNMYNVLWALVFGFATLNILGLVFRPFDNRKMGLTFGEMIAITVVIFSIVLFGLEILGVLHLLPIHLTPR